jgi:hypothetical protein
MEESVRVWIDHSGQITPLFAGANHCFVNRDLIRDDVAVGLLLDVPYSVVNRRLRPFEAKITVYCYILERDNSAR